jgi:ABC-type branched-subunit amino acid transport system ATPase component
VSGDPLLEVDHVDFSYGPLQVLFDVSIEVADGGRVALLGTNGAGKSTLLRVVSGLSFPQRGAVRLAGRDVTRLAPEDRVRLGLVQVNGGRSTFPSLTVRDNLRIGAYPFLGETATVRGRLDEVLDIFPALRSRLDQAAGTLSGGEQQMVALGRALIAGPRLLVIDELSLGLAPVVMQEILRMIDVLIDRGVTLLVVEQSLNVAMAISDTAYFLEKGEVRFSGATEGLLERGDLARSVFFGDRAPA